AFPHYIKERKIILRWWLKSVANVLYSGEMELIDAPLFAFLEKAEN
ncbi:MAG: hypothetical protein XD89_0720, partial [Anaerolineae bacterium 49_20]